ncbi:MAG: hypothetical protein AAFO07_01485 [Bacteroidota bacterium]
MKHNSKRVDRFENKSKAIQYDDAFETDNSFANVEKRKPPSLSFSQNEAVQAKSQQPVQRFLGSMLTSGLTPLLFGNQNLVDQPELIEFKAPADLKSSLTDIEKSLSKMNKFGPILGVPPADKTVKTKLFKGGVLEPISQAFGTYGEGLNGIKGSLGIAKAWIDMNDGKAMEKKKAHEHMKAILTFTSDAISFTRGSTEFVIDVVKKQNILNADDLLELDNKLSRIPDLHEGATGKTLTEIADGIGQMAKAIGLITDVFTILDDKASTEDIIKASINVGLALIELLAKNSVKNTGIAAWGGPLATFIGVIITAYDAFKLLEEYFTKKTIYEGLDFILTDLKADAEKMAEVANPMLVLESIKSYSLPEEVGAYNSKIKSYSSKLQKLITGFHSKVKPKKLHKALFTRDFAHEVNHKESGLLSPGHMKTISRQFTFMNDVNLSKLSPQGTYALTSNILEKVAYCMKNIKTLVDDEFSYNEDEDKKEKVYDTEGAKKRKKVRKALTNQYQHDKKLYNSEKEALDRAESPTLDIMMDVEDKTKLAKDLKRFDNEGYVSEELADYLRKEGYKANPEMMKKAKETFKSINNIVGGMGLGSNYAKAKLLVRIAHIEKDPLIMYEDDGSLMSMFKESDVSNVRALMTNAGVTEKTHKWFNNVESYFEQSYNSENIQGLLSEKSLENLR